MFVLVSEYLSWVAVWFNSFTTQSKYLTKIVLMTFGRPTRSPWRIPWKFPPPPLLSLQSPPPPFSPLPPHLGLPTFPLGWGYLSCSHFIVSDAFSFVFFNVCPTSPYKHAHLKGNSRTGKDSLQPPSTLSFFPHCEKAVIACPFTPGTNPKFAVLHPSREVEAQKTPALPSAPP